MAKQSLFWPSDEAWAALEPHLPHGMPDNSQVDDRSRPVAFAMTPGNVAESLRNWLKEAKIKPVIPSFAPRRTPYSFDRKAYRRRNLIERLFGRLRNWQRIATRYDKLATNYLSAIVLVSAISSWV